MLYLSYEELADITDGKWYNLSGQNTEISVCISTDTRERVQNALFVALKGNNYDGHDFLSEAIQNNAKAICIEEGNRHRLTSMPPIPILEVRNSLLALQKIASHHRKRLHNLTLIAVTGSNGKTSTKEILSQILVQEYGEDKVYATKANTNNQIGVPINLLNLTHKHKVAVIELGTNHPGEIGLLASIVSPDIAIITSIGPAHLEYFKNLDGVAREKAAIFNYFQPGDNRNLAIIPEDILMYAPIRQVLCENQYFTFSQKSATSFVSYTPIEGSMQTSTFDLTWNVAGVRHTVSWNILGTHQLGNAAAAAIAATYIGITPENTAKYLRNCKLTGMRMKIREVNKITIINDAYNANPASTVAGIIWIESLLFKPSKNNYFIVLGDMLELGDTAFKAHVDVLNLALEKLAGCYIITIGDTMKEALCYIEKKTKKSSPHILNFADAEKGASYITKHIEPGDFIYLKGSRGNKLEIIDEALRVKIMQI